MWAEEATTHLQDSFDSNIWEILFFIPHNEGYICLNRNITTIITKFFDISLAASITTYSAFLVQLIPHCIIILSNHSFWGRRIERLLLSTSIIIIPVGTGETWLNTTCSHYHLGVLAFIILLDLHKNISRKKLIGYTILLCLGALSSPITCFLLPTFILGKYLVKRLVSNFLLIPYLVCCLFQLFVSIINITKEKGLGATRFDGFNILEFPIILINDVIIKGTIGDFGLNQFLNIISSLTNLMTFDRHYIYWIILIFIFFCIGFILKNRKILNIDIILIIFSFISVFFYNLFFSICKFNTFRQKCIVTSSNTQFVNIYGFKEFEIISKNYNLFNIFYYSFV